MMAGAFVLPEGLVGEMEAPATRRPSMPCTRYKERGQVYTYYY